MRQNPLVGRPGTAPRQSWSRTVEGPDGIPTVVKPMPGKTYTRENYPPRGRGKGHSLTSPQRIFAKQRAVKVLRLRQQGLTFREIADMLGFRDPSGPYRAMKRAVDRVDWDRQRRRELRKGRS